jgi:hypothetical protein
MYPVIVYEEGTVLPTEGTYYIVAGNGTFLQKNTGIVSCLTQVKDIPFLADVKNIANLRFNLPKVPAHLTWGIKELFKRVVKNYYSEANTMLYYNKATKEFQVRVPKQTVTHGGVEYDSLRTDIEENPDPAFLLVGTIHSHCDFAAFHSGTDVNDEADFDGLHVTFGHNHENVFTISACIVVNGKRQQVTPEDYLEGIAPVGDRGYYCLLGTPEYDETQQTEWMSNIQSLTQAISGNEDKKN